MTTPVVPPRIRSEDISVFPSSVIRTMTVRRRSIATIRVAAYHLSAERIMIVPKELGASMASVVKP
jgi:hypothetical protein